MVIGVARAGLISGANIFKFNIASNQVDANLRTLANAAGYSGYGDVEATINGGVDLYASSTSSYGLNIGSFPSGRTVTLINNGYISGAGGAGGTAWRDYESGSTPVAPTAGGPALYCVTSGFILKINNANTIRGGGGGGGYGPVGSGSYYYEYYDFEGNLISGSYSGAAGGGGGGGGQGTQGGAGGGFGSSAGASGSSGTAGNSSSGGGGGGSVVNNDGFTGGAGGAGGSWGSSGSSGLAPPDPQNGYTPIGYAYGPSAGGAGGAATVGNSYVTWLATGTRYGTIS
jgi:hypothetical protein